MSDRNISRCYVIEIHTRILENNICTTISTTKVTCIHAVRSKTQDGRFVVSRKKVSNRSSIKLKTAKQWETNNLQGETEDNARSCIYVYRAV